jgi:hypothetical protein
MLYADFRAQVRRDLEEPVENVWKDSSILYWVNEAKQDIAARVRSNEDESFTTSLAGVSDYDLPANTQEITAVYYNGQRLSRETPESRFTVPGGSGTPITYQRMDEVLRLRPTPDTDSTDILIVRKSYPPDITSDTDAVPFGGQHNSALEYFVLSRAFEQTQDWQSSDAYKQRYEAVLATFDIDANIAADADGASSYPTETY